MTKKQTRAQIRRTLQKQHAVSVAQNQLDDHWYEKRQPAVARQKQVSDAKRILGLILIAGALLAIVIIVSGLYAKG